MSQYQASVLSTLPTTFPLGNPQREFSHIPFECLNKLGNLRLYYHTEPFSFGPLERLYFFQWSNPIASSQSSASPSLLRKLKPLAYFHGQHLGPGISSSPYLTESLYPCSPNLYDYFFIPLLCLDWLLISQSHWVEVCKQVQNLWVPDRKIWGPAMGLADPPSSQLGWWQANAQTRWS